MSRSDMHVDAMLRHLGAAYYDSLHGRADDADVSKVVVQVATHMGQPAADARAIPKRRSGRTRTTTRIAAACATS